MLDLKGHFHRFVLALPASVNRSQETWHNALAVTISRLNFIVLDVTEKYSKWFLKIVILLWDLNPTLSASRAIALPSRPHTSKNEEKATQTLTLTLILIILFSKKSNTLFSDWPPHIKDKKRSLEKIKI